MWIPLNYLKHLEKLFRFLQAIGRYLSGDNRLFEPFEYKKTKLFVLSPGAFCSQKTIEIFFL